MSDKVSQNIVINNRLEIKKEVSDDCSQETVRLETNNGDLYSTLHVEVKAEPSAKLNSLKKALLLNAEICKLLKDDIEKMKAAYEKNLEKQAILKKILKEEKTAIVKSNDEVLNEQKTISVFAAPYFRDVNRMVPPINEDMKIKRKNRDVNAYLRPPRPWAQSENKKLLNGVTGFALMSALKPFKIKRDKLKEKLKDKNLLDFEIEVLENQLDRIERKIKTISEKPLYELLTKIEGNIDWMTISSSYMEGIRPPEECENMWNNYLNFSINKDIFSKEEDELLRNLAEDNNERDWDLIANSMQTNRTPIQCFERYQTRLNSNLHRRFWTKDEDARLIALVNELKCGEIIPWNKISLLMEGRTRQQCINRYDRSISQAYNRGPWTPEEDAILIACYHKFGVHWAKMKYFFRRRSIYSIRERYVNALNPSIKMGCWTKEEDRLLISLIRQYGYGKWSKICKKIPGRTDNMCMVRAGKLLEYSIQFYSKKGVEIDPGIYDPLCFAKILKPLAPSKICVQQNLKLKMYRKNAIALLLQEIKKIHPDFKVEGNVDSVDFSWLSSAHLQHISEELHNRLLDSEERATPFSPHIRYFTQSPRLRKRQVHEDSDIEPESSPVKRVTAREKEKLDSELAVLSRMYSKNGLNKAKRKPKVFNSREAAEMSLYKAYLYKQFSCSAVCDEDDDIENVIFSGIDFSETLQTVVSYFIQPPIYENQFIVLEPNLTTMSGMETVEITEDRLLNMSESVSHSKNYIDYICERRKSCPKCLQCLYREGKLNPKVGVESVIENMKNKHFVLTETMETSAYIEAASTNKCVEICSCASLEESQKSVQLLRKRFMALFLWPSLLAFTSFSKEQDDSLCNKTATAKDYFLRLRMSSSVSQRNKKRKRKIAPEKKPAENSGHPSTGDVIPKVKRQCKRKDENPVVRRSKRACVLRRTSFAFSKVKGEKTM